MTYLWIRIDPLSLALMFDIIVTISAIGYGIYEMICKIVEDHKDRKS